MSIELIRLQIYIFCSSNFGIYILLSTVRNRVTIYEAVNSGNVHLVNYLRICILDAIEYNANTELLR